MAEAKVSEYWRTKIAAMVAETLASIPERAGVEYWKTVGRACPFKEDSRLCQAWYCEIRRQRQGLPDPHAWKSFRKVGRQR